VDEAEQRAALLRLRAAVATAFGDLQVVLLRELTARLKAGDPGRGHSLPVEAMTDQLAAAVRETQFSLDAAQRHEKTPPRG
jgi:hypothetical protein